MAGPSLKFRNEVKLHISKGPGVRSWTIFAGLVSLGLLAAMYATDCLFGKCFLIVICLGIGLTLMEGWEDCVMDRYQNLATLTRCNWYDRLCSRVPESHTHVLPLSNVTTVKVTASRQLMLVFSSGQSIPITSSMGSRKELLTLIGHISSFLRLNRVESVADPWEETGSEGEDWGDAATGEPFNDTGADPPVPHRRIRDIIKVLAEPSPPSDQ